MDWSRAKTILIVTFFCLNVFLVYQLVEKRSDSNLGVLTPPSFQHLLDNQNITINLSDPNYTPRGYHVTGMPQSFNDEELLADFGTLDVELGRQEYELVVELEEPERLLSQNLPGSVNAFLQSHLMNGEEYAFGYYNEEENYIRAYQTYDGELLQYLSGDSHVRIDVNEDLEAIGYSQRYLNLTGQTDQETELISPNTAIESLANANLLGTDFEISEEDVELMYTNVSQNDVSAIEFYTPVWRITIDDEDRYVNAIEGSVIRSQND
ncbi:two-component system regulatory protein YycI [Alteribacter aurantiacus]|uniref:two-component system regulatory protein YycI n=1 Tax=Alteribacter aurantiacus TaxID=254410 RepID=UPI00041435C5|nr:two-component system regulatory protein YycI [Alteribacter aurantiacus]